MSADGWEDVPNAAAPAQPAKADDGWTDVPAAGAPAAPPAPTGPSPPISGPDGWTSASHDLVNSTPTGSIMSAFGQGFREASGPEPLGLSDDSVKWLAKVGIFGSGSKFENPFQAFNEGVILPAAAALDGAMRMVQGTYRGSQAAGIEAGLPKDVVSLPDAFMGSPGALGEIKMRSGLPKDAPVGKPLATLSQAPPFDAFHGSPYSFDVFSTQHIGKGEGAQSYGHGLYFAENPDVAGKYAEKLGGGEGNTYQVKISADPEKLFDLDKRLSEQTPAVQDSIKQAMGIDYYGKFDQEKSDRTWAEFKDANGKVAVRQGFISSDDEVVAQRLRDAGIPGLKYLDSGSRAGEGPGTSNFVIFNEGDIQITHKNGEPIPTPQDRMAQAHDMGVIGPERPPITEGTAAEAAQRSVMPASAKPGESVSGEVGGGDAPNAWRERFDSFVGKIETGADAKQLITDAADQNGDFQAARAGDIPLQQFGDLAQAAGVDAATVDRSGVGRLLQNDNQVRNAMQAMLTATDDVRSAARDVKSDGSPESLMKLQEAMLRRDTWVEQVVGHRAEWGRTGNVFQEFLQRSKEEGGFSAWLKDQDRSPEGLRKIAEGIDGLDPAQAAKFLSDANKPTFWDQFKYYWVNSLISGPVTHAKYIVANAAFAGYESAVVTPVAGAVGAVRRALTGGEEGVYMGEAAARTWGIIAGVPDAIRAGVQAAKTGLQTPLPGELAQGIVPKRNQNVAYQQRPIPGKLGAVIGIPSRGAGAIHSAFNFLGYRASIEAQAYRQAVKEGLRPGPSGPPPVPSGMTRFYHGTAYKDASGFIGDTFVTPHYNYARDYHGGRGTNPDGTIIPNHVLYTDIPHAEADARGLIDEVNRYPINGPIKDGAAILKPLDPTTTGDGFWQRRQALANAPTPEMMNDAIEDGYRLTYISELGDTGRKLSAFVNSTKVGQLVMPFTHIPLNILKRAVEGTPAAFLDADTRAALSGEAGAAKQDMAVARMVAGSAVGAWAVNQVLNERMTGYGPTDPTERAQWMATGHQPYSIRIGDYWYSFNRFGSLGTMLGLYSNLAEVIPHMKPDAEELTKAIAMTVHSTGRLMEDEVGMQGLAGLMEAIDEPERKGTRFVSNFAGSLLPFSSAQRQVASAMDPYMRETKSIVDGLRYYIPVARQDLLPKRDWTGLPVANASYGGDVPNAPGVSSIIQHRNAVADPVATEMAALGLRPAPPQDRIKGVKLPPKLYDTYQSTAGPFTRTALEAMVNQPGWHDIPVGIRQEVFKRTIEATRQAAGAAMQMRYPQLIEQGVQDRIARIQGGKPGKMQDASAP